MKVNGGRTRSMVAASLLTHTESTVSIKVHGRMACVMAKDSVCILMAVCMMADGDKACATARAC